MELKKTPSQALSRLMAKEFLRRKGGGALFARGAAESSPRCDVG